MYHLSVCLCVVRVCCLCLCACVRPLFDVRYSNGCQDCQCLSHYASGLSGLSTWGWLKQKSTLLEADSSVRTVANATINTYKVSLSPSDLAHSLSLPFSLCQNNRLYTTYLSWFFQACDTHQFCLQSIHVSRFSPAELTQFTYSSSWKMSDSRATGQFL